ncbi:hypothetical protein BKA82DRAFT_36491 [Pisolithus tinctorius]|nr:hypothetical protein BKA82DRAFT_36491 [Pisolithus tinctorius]
MWKVLWRHARGFRNLEGPWQDYLGEAFEESGIQTKMKMAKKAARTVKVDAVSLVTNEDGTVSIGEIAGLSRDLLQKTVRWATSTVPFKQLGTHQKSMIATRHLPPNFSFTVDPSHIVRSQQATELLSFWSTTGQEHRRCGKLQPPAVDSGIPIQIVRDWRSRSRTPATAPAQSKAPAGRTQRAANTVQPNVQGSDMDDFERASPVIFEGADMPSPSHDRHGRVSNGGKKIAADVETDHDDDPLDDGWPQANQQEASNSDEVDRSEGLGAADELPTLAKEARSIKDGSEHQGDDHLRSLPIAQDAPPNPVGRGNKRPEDVAQPHSATASKGHQIPLRNGKGTDSKSGQRQLAVSRHLEIPWVLRPLPGRMDVPSPPSKRSRKHTLADPGVSPGKRARMQ